MTLALIAAVVLSQAQPTAKLIKAADAAMTTADFQRALKILKNVDAKTASADELLRVHLLRAECFLAIQRPIDAEAALADAVRLKLTVSLDESASPTLRAALDRVKERMVGTLAIHSNVKGATALLDGKPVGQLPLVVAALAGKHSVGLESKELPPWDVEVIAGRTTEVALDFAAPAPIVAAPIVKPAPAAPRRSPARIASVAAGGLGVVALASSAVAGGLAYSSFKAVENASKSNNLGLYEQERASLRSRSIAADVLLATGIVALGTGVVLYLFSDSPVGVALVPSQHGAAFAVGGSF